jgi:tRNA nucleotidyltransferase (CCA-adding enzyme)
MVLAAREFLSRPRLAFFERMSGRARPALRKSVVAVVFSHTPLSEDTLWGELRKTTKHVVRHVEVAGFRVARSMAASNNKDRSAILLIPEFETLPKLEQRVGPTVDRRADVRAFLASNRTDSRLVWVDDDARVRLLRPREDLELSKLLQKVARGDAGPVGASKELAAGMKRTGSVLLGGPLARAAQSTSWLDQGIREISTDALGTRAP